MKSVNDRWYQDLFSAVISRSGLRAPKDIASSLDSIRTSVVSDLAAHLQGQNFDHMGRGGVEEFLNGCRVDPSSQAAINRVMGWYQDAYDYNKLLVNSRNNENWSNSQDHFKSWLYRITNGLSIGAIILLVGWLVGRWGIELILIRL